MLLANLALRPGTTTRKGRKQYAYTIHQERPDWIKGDNPAECVAYVLAWFDGFESRVAGSVRRADLRGLTDGPNGS